MRSPLCFAEVPLLDGSYPVTIGLHSHDEATVYDWSEQRHSFEVMSPTRALGTIQLKVDVAVNGVVARVYTVVHEAG